MAYGEDTYGLAAYGEDEASNVTLVAAQVTETDAALAASASAELPAAGRAVELETTFAAAIQQQTTAGQVTETDTVPQAYLEWVTNPSGATSTTGWGSGNTPGHALSFHASRTTSPPAGSPYSTAIYMDGSAIPNTLVDGVYVTDETDGDGALVGASRAVVVEFWAYVEGTPGDVYGRVELLTYNSGYSSASGLVFETVTGGVGNGLLEVNQWTHVKRIITTPIGQPNVVVEYGAGSVAGGSGTSRIYLNGLSISTGPLASLTGRATETDTALPAVRSLGLAAGRASETDIVLPVTRFIGLGQATETDLARPISYYRGYLAKVLQDHPWGLWPNDDASGSLRDISGNGYDMTVTGSVSYAQTGPRGDLPATYWDTSNPNLGGGAYHYATTVATVAAVRSTVEVWVKFTDLPLPGELAVIAAGGYPDSDGTPDKALFVDEFGRLSYLIYTAGDPFYFEARSTNTVSLDTWYHIVGTLEWNLIDGAHVKVRVNKVPWASQPVSSGVHGNLGSYDEFFYPFTIHGNARSFPYYDLRHSTKMHFGPVAFFDQSLTPAQTDAHYDAASNLFPINIISESDSALPGGFTFTVGSSQVTETDVVLGAGVTQRTTAAIVTETDTTAAATTTALSQLQTNMVDEFDQVSPTTNSFLVVLSSAVELDSALQITVTQSVTFSRALEADQALPALLAVFRTVLAQLVTEVDQTMPLVTATASPYVTITHSYLRGDGTAAEGSVSFAPRFLRAESVLPPAATYTNAQVVRVVDGEFEISLLEANPASATPGSWTYRVVERIDNLLLDYDAYVDFAPASVDLRELVPAAPDDGVP